MKLARLSIIFLFSFIVYTAEARDIVVVGQVLTCDSVPIEAAEVWFPGTRLGAVTNADGFFYLRSPEPQRALAVSVIGYKRRRIKLDYGHDAMLTVVMEEEYSVLNEIVLSPDNQQVLDLIKRVARNNRGAGMLPDAGFTSEQVNMTDLPNRLMQRRLFRNISSGAISRNDSTFSLPAYSALRLQYPDSVIYLGESALPVFSNAEWRALVHSYAPQVNLYQPTVTILGSNFLSPVVRQPGSHYRYYLIDSVATDSTKTYRVKFKPKYNSGNYLQGTLDIDSADAGIVAAEVRTAEGSNVPFLNSFEFAHSDTASRQALSLSVNPIGFRGGELFGLMLFSDSRFLNRAPSHSNTQSTEPPNAAMIDSLKNSPFIRFAYGVFDFFLTEYIHAGPIDIGPVFDMFHYNRYDGATPLISLRTNKKMLPHFTVGGYVGYAHGLDEWFYGGNVQWMTRNEHHKFGLFYDHRSEKYGFDEQYVFEESRVEAQDNILSSLSQIKRYSANALRTQIRARYTYEQRFRETGLRLLAELRGQRIYPENAHFIDNLALRADVRLSWRDRYLAPYFTKFYLRSDLPVLHIYGEAGHYTAAAKRGHYGRIGIYVRQSLPVGFGRFYWSARASKLFGRVPFPLLDYARSLVSSFTMSNDLMLANQMEFAADALFTATLRYQTRGFIFGYIPGIKKMGIREDLYLNIAYGLISADHRSVMPLSEHTVAWGKAPYIEAGFGLSNIFSLFKVQFMFRCTYRNMPEAELFRVKWGVEL